MPLVGYPIFASCDPLADLTEQGWEVWHRGNFFDEETLTTFYHLYRDPAKAATRDEYPHRRVRVRYTFRDGQLWPEKPEEDDEKS